MHSLNDLHDEVSVDVHQMQHSGILCKISHGLTHRKEFNVSPDILDKSYEFNCKLL